MSLRIRKNDVVVVLSGQARGKRGKILRFNSTGQRAFVEGINLVKRFVRRTRQNPQGGQVERESSVHVSNLALYSEAARRGVRYRIKINADRTKNRICAKTGEVLDKI